MQFNIILHTEFKKAEFHSPQASHFSSPVSFAGRRREVVGVLDDYRRRERKPSCDGRHGRLRSIISKKLNQYRIKVKYSPQNKNDKAEETEPRRVAFIST